MEIKELRYVKTVAEYGNLTRAAEHLNITQPSLSQSIKLIEKRLDMILFIRSKRGMIPTDQCRRLLDDLQPLMREYSRFMSKIQQYNTLGDTHHIGLYKLSYTTPVNDAIMSFISLHNEDNFSIKVEAIKTLEKLVLNHQLNLAVVKYSPVFKRHSALAYDLLYQEKLHVHVSTDHPLASRDAVSIRELVGNKLITSAPDEYPYEMTKQVLEDAGIDLEIHTYTNYYNLSMIFDLVSKGMGIGFATRDVAAHFKRKDIVSIPLEEEYYYDICLVENLQDRQSDKNQQLKSFLREYITKRLSEELL